MTYELQEQDATKVTIAVRAPWAELEARLPKAAEVISAELEIEGFRKGKAPYDVVKAKVGEFKILEQAARMHIEKNFAKTLGEIEEKEFAGGSFEPVGEPAVSITKLVPGEDLEYRIALSILPPVELPDYRAIAARILTGKNIPEVTENEVRSSLEWLRESRAKLITVNRGAGIGDRVEIDFATKLDGVALEGGQSKNHPFILGQGTFIPGFEGHLAGMRAGEEKTFSLAVPADYRSAAIAGKVLDFTVTVNLVQKRELPEWNDEFAKSLGNFSSAAEAEVSLRRGLGAEKEREERERLRMAMVEAIAAEVKTEIPATLVERELDTMIAELRRSVEPAGLTFADYLAHLKRTEEELRGEWKPDAKRRIRIALALREIARRENIQPSEEEIQQAANRTLAHWGLTEEDTKKLDPVRGPSRQRRDGSPDATSGLASNGVDRTAFLDYNRGVARNEKVFRFLENLSDASVVPNRVILPSNDRS